MWGNPQSPIKNKEKIAQDTERNYFMTSYNAIEYGLIDKII